MVSQIKSDFSNLPQRMIYYYIATYAPFYPRESSVVSADQQYAAHQFVYGIYNRLYDDPTILDLKLESDDSFDDYEPQKNKPMLAPKMRGIIKKIDEFIGHLYHLCLDGELIGDTIKLSKQVYTIKNSTMKHLNGLGIPCHATTSDTLHNIDHDTALALKYLAKLSAQSDDYPALQFSGGVFDETSPYTIDIFRSLAGNDRAYLKLVDYFTQSNYTRIDNRDGKISLDFVKEHGSIDSAVKSAWAERTHSGIEFSWEEIRRNQLHIGLRIPYFAKLLAGIDNASPNIRQYVVRQSKKCDNCNYCIQTDKTGTRPKSYVPVQFDEATYNICPLFPGFQHRWRALNDELADELIAFLKYIDAALGDRQQ